MRISDRSSLDPLQSLARSGIEADFQLRQAFPDRRWTFRPIAALEAAIYLVAGEAKPLCPGIDPKLHFCIVTRQVGSAIERHVIACPRAVWKRQAYEMSCGVQPSDAWVEKFAIGRHSFWTDRWEAQASVVARAAA